MSLKVLATIGPASLNKQTIEEMTKKGIDLFRINLSHTKIEDLESVIAQIQSWTKTEVCLDSEGAQVRNQDMKNNSVTFIKGDKVKIHHKQIIGDSQNISFTPDNISRQLIVGDRIKIDFDSAELRIIDLQDDYINAIVEQSGEVGSNKAANIDRHIRLDALTQKDKDAFQIGLKMGIKNYSLSFTNCAKDVKDLRNIIGSNSNLISKIESIEGVMNLKEILPLVDQILIDRGDLSREIPIEKIPFMQRRIIAYSKSKNTPVFVATNLLESMITSRSPTRAEVNDVISTLLMGSDGLVLAAETAIGKFPVDSVNMIYALLDQFNKWSPESTFLDIINS